jgi:hypothetical protein
VHTTRNYTHKQKMTKIINYYYNKTNVMNATIKTATNYFFYNLVHSLRKEMPLNSVNRNNNKHIECSFTSQLDAGIVSHNVRQFLGRKRPSLLIFQRKVQTSLHSYFYVDCT